MQIEYRLTADGRLLEPGDADREAYENATRRWVVASLPREPEAWRSAQAAALSRCDFRLETEATTTHLADAVLAPHGATNVPDDVVAMRISLLRLSEGATPVAVRTVQIVAQLDRAVTTSTDEKLLERLVQRVRGLPRSRRQGSFVVVRALLSIALEDATTLADQVTARTSELEQDVFSSAADDDHVTDLYRLKRTIADARRHLLPIVNKLSLVVEIDDAELGEDAVTHLERIEAGFRRVTDGLETDDRLLGDMLTAQLTMVQVQQNSDMRRISSYAALAAVPTLVAGIYGMNFTHMPELTWTYGYPMVLIGMLGLVLGLRWAFRRSGWL